MWILRLFLHFVSLFKNSNSYPSSRAKGQSPSLVIQLPIHVQLFETPWTAGHQASLSLTVSQSLPKFMFIASVVPPSHLILWCPLLLQPSIFPSIRNFSNQLALRIRWPKYHSFGFSISLQELFQSVGPSRQMTKIPQLQLQHQSFQRVFKVDFFMTE